MAKRIWKFLLDENNRKALSLIGCAIAATAAAIWAVWLYFAPPLPSGAKSGVSSTTAYSAAPTSPPPQSSHAEARDGGIAINAQDEANVSVNQTIINGEQNRPKNIKHHTEPSVAVPGAHSGDRGVSVTAKDSSDVKVRQEVR